ncbi:MAG: N-acetylneuraminate synthase [Bacteroidetes bacterium]|nr:N-acetylneuraminate synthase [Bacteroidota bacterium]
MGKVLIIAEAGVNHNGNFDLAIAMIDEAKKSGADIVKFQTAIPELVMTSAAPKAKYQARLTGAEESQLEMAKKIHLPLDAYKKLQTYCNSKKIEFLSTAFDLKSFDLLEKLKVRLHKIPSGDITNYPLLVKAAKTKKHVILSTGMCCLSEIEEAIKVLLNNGMKRNDITLMHCTTEYPTPFEDVNLNAMNTLKKAFGVQVGYSDHTPGIEVPIAAVAMGATVIEKHFTLDKNMIGPDHKASLEPNELSAMVKAIRNIEKSMGNGLKIPGAAESKNIIVARRSIHIASNLKKGYTLKESDLIMKRPGDGISPMNIKKIIGRSLKTNLTIDHKLRWEDLK